MATTNDVDSLLASLPNVVARYDNKTETPGLVTLDGLTIALKKPDGTADESTKLYVKHVELSGFDGAAIRKVFDAASYTGTPDESFQTLASKVVFTELSVIVKDKPILTLASHTIDGLEMKQFSFVPGGADFMAQFKTPQLAPIQILGGIADSVRFADSVSQGLHADMDYATLYSFYPPGMIPTPPPPGSVTYDIREMDQNGYDRGKIGAGTMHDMTTASKMDMPQSPGMPDGMSMNFTQSIQEGTVDGADISKLLPWMIRAEMPPTTRDGLWSYGRACFTNYNMAMENVGAFNVPNVCIDPIQAIWLIPDEFDMTIAGTFTPAFGGPFVPPPYVAQYFNRPLAAEFQVAGDYDPDAGTGALTHYRFRLETFGTVDFAITGGGLQLDTLMNLPQTYQQTLTLVSGSLTLDDEGGIDKILAMSAASGSAGANADPAALKMQAKAGVDLMVGMLGNTTEAAAIGQSIKDFLDQGGTLIVKAEPPKPLSDADMQAMAGKAPAQIMQELGVSATRSP